MICTFASLHASWIPSVKLEGYVKTASKEKWERIFDLERRGIAHGHDQDAAMKALPPALAELL
jgi:hypothetical protein